MLIVRMGLAADNSGIQDHTEGGNNTAAASHFTQRIIQRRLSEANLVHPQSDPMNALFSGCIVVLLPPQGNSIVLCSVVSREEYMREPTQRSPKGNKHLTMRGTRSELQLTYLAS